MDDLNDIIWNSNSKSLSQATDKSKNQGIPKPVSFTSPSSSRPSIPSGSNYNFNSLSYQSSNQRTHNPNYSFQQTPIQSQSNNSPVNKDIKEDPFASLVTFKPSVQKKSLQEQQLEREATKSKDSYISIPNTWNGSLYNKSNQNNSQQLPVTSQPPKLPNSFEPQKLPQDLKAFPKITPPLKNTVNSLDNHDNFGIASESQAIDVFDFMHLSSQSKTPKSSTPLNEDDELLGLLGKPVEEVKRLQSVSPQEDSLDSKLAQLLALGHDIEVSKTALSLTGDNDVKSAHSLITQHLQAEKQTHNDNSFDSSDDEAGLTNNFKNTQYTNYSSNTNSRASPNLFNRDQLLNQAEEVGNSVLSAASTIFFRSKKIIKNTWEEIQSRSNSGSATPGSRASQYDFGNRDSPSFFDDSDDPDEVDTSKNQEINVKPPPKPVRQKSSNATPPQSIEKVVIILPKDTIHASADQLIQSEKLKKAGNEKFRVGQYGDANELYTQALDTLPLNHSARIPILTNRSFALEKIGHFKDSLDDAEQAIQIIGDDKSYMPTPSSSCIPTGKASLPLRDFYAKSLLRKALAHEGLETYPKAVQTYEVLTSFPVYRLKALEGVRRCKQMSKAPAPEVLSTSIPVIINQKTSGPVVSSEEIGRNRAVQALREKEVIQAAEDARRFEVSDEVDSKLSSWRKGREGNLRALLASLDTILWPDLRWEAVSLPNLIEIKNVKRHYMRAISKLHPDKLSSSTSVENRLLAGHVFAALNLAWDQFRADNSC